MTNLGGCFLNIASQLLEPPAREAVLGDLIEAGENGWQGFFALLGLLVHQQAAHWGTWRPWLAAFGLALPGSFLLMGFSLGVSRAYQHWLGPEMLKVTGLTIGSGFWLLLCNTAMLGSLAWTGGCAIGTLSKRTV